MAPMVTWNPKANEVFLEAVERLPGEIRDAYLNEACGADADLRAQVEALLEASDRAGSFLESPALEEPRTSPFDPVTERPGTVIGPYKLLQQIGEGGMGVVFMAEQTRPVQRTVALKIIKPGMDTRQVIARFEAERQALALMDHPNIARVLDAGTTDTGRPYFVMDLVKGVPITDYCDQQHLPVRERLELVSAVCHAVQHAHQKGIIHRDLKPSNVLVAEYDGKPVPKIIDFGVAKATAQKLTEKTMFTELGQMVGTVEYMSPEQARFNQLDIDTRSDVYSLGVLLYELLTGSTPFGRKRLNEAAFDEMLRIIREEEPPKPSTRLSSSDALPSIAANRSLEPLKLNRLVQGELDWIVMKCLEKDRNRRYETANGVADDVHRYLNDDAVQACPPSAAYRFRKFARRNKVALTMGSLIIAAMVVSVVVLTVSNVWVRQERDAKEEALREKIAALALAEANFRKARAAVDKSFTLVSESDLFDATGLQPLRKQLLESALHYYREFADQRPDDPKLEAELAAAHFRMWQVYGLIGQSPESTAALAQSLDIVDKLRADQPMDPEVLHILGTIKYGAPPFHSTWSEGTPAAEQETIRMLRRAADTWAGLVADHSDMPQFQRNLAQVYDELANKLRYRTPSEALQVAEKAYEIRERLDPDRPVEEMAGRDSSRNRSVLALYLMWAGRWQEAQEAFQQSLDLSEKQAARFPKERQPRARAAYLNRRMGELLSGHAGQHEQAESYYRRAIAWNEGLVRDFPGVGSARWYLSDCHNRLGNVLEALGRTQEAEQNHARAVQLVQELVSDYPDNTAYLEHAGTYQIALARCLLSTGRSDDAEKLCRSLIDFLEELTTKNSVDRVHLCHFYFELGSVLHTLGKSQEAERAFRSAKKNCEELVAEFPDVSEHRLNLGHAYRWLNQQAEAVAEFSKAIEKWPNDARFLHWRAAAFSSLGQHDRAVTDLWGAFRKGYADVGQLKNDPSFDPLRSREDFKNLLGEIDKRNPGGEDQKK